MAAPILIRPTATPPEQKRPISSGRFPNRNEQARKAAEAAKAVAK